VATGIEVWFGYTYEEYDRKAPIDAPRLPEGTTAGNAKEEGNSWYDRFQEYADIAAVRNPLETAWVGACMELGWKVGKKKGRYWPVTTPAGRSEFVPFSLHAQYGGEMEFDFPDLPVGVALSGRYYPRFLDYKTDGCLPNPLVLWTPEMERMIEVARVEILKYAAWLMDGKLMIVEQHY
jgi:hypothetical protein